MIRKIRGWIKDKAGVSPIIAIILMVAITVVLAATIYVWVSGMGKGGTSTPSLSMIQTEKGAGYVMYLVTGVSEPIPVSDLAAQIGTSSADITETNVNGTSGYVDAGDYIKISYSDGSTASVAGETVTIIHTPSGSVLFNAKVR